MVSLIPDIFAKVRCSLRNVASRIIRKAVQIQSRLTSQWNQVAKL